MHLDPSIRARRLERARAIAAAHAAAILETWIMIGRRTNFAIVVNPIDELGTYEVQARDRLDLAAWLRGEDPSIIAKLTAPPSADPLLIVVASENGAAGFAVAALALVFGVDLGTSAQAPAPSALH